MAGKTRLAGLKFGPAFFMGNALAGTLEDLVPPADESGLPAVVRGRVPLLLCGECVLAVANLPGLDGPARGDWQLHWQPPTSDQDLS